MNGRILLVEDDSTLAMIVSETLQRDGFEVITAVNGEDGLHKFARGGAALIVADVMMPRMDGFEMARQIRQIDRHVPIIFLTAKSEIEDIVEGFELGGNDYLKKPFKMLELIVRIKALLRKNTHDDSEPLAIGQYILDMPAQRLEHPQHNSIQLTIIEAKILRELAMNRGNTVDASALMHLIWQRNDPYTRNSLHGFIHKLRHYLRHDNSISILNQRGIGYMLAIKNKLCDNLTEVGENKN